MKSSWLNPGSEPGDSRDKHDSIMYDSSSNDEDNISELEDTSLSLTKHVPSDIGDDGVDDIVAQAEAFLESVDKQLADENVDSGEDSEAPPLPVKHSTKSAHKYLSASESITYEPEEISVDSEESDHLTKEDCDETEEYWEVDKEKCWSDNLRGIDIEVPEDITDDWLNSLPLATVPEDAKSSIPSLVEELQEKISIKDPQEEFKQQRNVPITDECSTALLQQNRAKNRFRNVLPCKLKI